MKNTNSKTFKMGSNKLLVETPEANIGLLFAQAIGSSKEGLSGSGFVDSLNRRGIPNNVRLVIG